MYAYIAIIFKYTQKQKIIKIRLFWVLVTAFENIDSKNFHKSLLVKK